MRLLLFIFLLLPVAASGQDMPAPESIDYASKWGIVTFEHQAHLQRAKDCLTCHHQGVEMGRCGNCHGVIPGLPVREDVLHKKCTQCHWTSGGPTGCSGCHDPERLDESVYDD